MKNRRPAVLASACGLLLLTAPVAIAAPNPPFAAAPSEGAEADSSPVRIVTYNAQYKRSPAEVVADIRKIMREGADVIGLQEMGGLRRRTSVREKLVDCASCRYDAYMDNTAVQNATPILYKSAKFRLLSTGWRQLSDTTYVGRAGAGPATLKPKFVNYVELQHRVTDRTIYVLNSHAVASVQGRDGGRNTKHPARLRLYRQHMDGLKRLITKLRATGDPVFSTGDFNVNYRRDSVVRDPMFPYVNMREVGVHASYEYLGMPDIGTHQLANGNNTRLIDYVFSLDHAAVTPRKQEILQGYGSDHRPVMVRFALDRR